MSDPAKNPVKSVEHSIAIIEAMLQTEGGTVSEIATRVPLTKGAVHSHLATLQNAGYVEKHDRIYSLSLGWLTFGGFARDRLEIYQLGQPVVDELADQTGELALLSTEFRGKSLYLYQRAGKRAVTTDSYTGVRLPLHCTGTGKALLAQFSEPRVNDIIERYGLVEFTENTITEIATLAEELESVREAGFALDDEERIDGMRGIGVPIMDQETDSPVGAISISGPTHRVSDEYFREELPSLLQKSAREIEINLTYS